MEHRNPWLDVCRAAAIGMVMLSHSRTFLLPIFPSLNGLKFGGFLGVELFFVLSGFLIGSIMLKQVDRSPSAFGWLPQFWMRRWLRTLPNYFLFVLINIALIGSIRPAPWPNLLAYATFTQNLFTPIPTFFIESWSLSVEEIFYLVTPLAVSLSLARVGKKRLAVLIAAVSIMALSFAARVTSVLHYDQSFGDVRATVVLRLDAIMVGVVMAWMHAHAAWRPRLTRLAWVGTPLFLVAAVASAAPDSFLDQSRLLRIFLFPAASVGCAALIYVGIASAVPKPADALTSRIARWSYSAYLANVPVIATIRYVYPNPSELGCWVSLATYVVGTFAISFALYEMFEKRVLRLRDAIARPQPAM